MRSDLEPCTSLEATFEALGLDGSFWTKVFKDELEVTDIKHLKYLDNEDFEVLKKHIRYRWEIRALQKLFEGNSEPGTAKVVGKEAEKPVLAEHLPLPNLRPADTMTQNMAKELESTLTHALEEPRSTHIRERPLKDCVGSSIKKFSTNNDLRCLPAISITDKEILNTASGGLALQGIFKTGNVEDLLKDRRQLIKIDDCKFAGPRNASCYMEYEFSSYKSHQKFLGSVEKLGYSFIAELTLGLRAGKVGLQNASLSSTSFQSQSERSYMAMTVCHYMPLASAFIDQLTLSDSAEKALIEINELLHTTDQDENPNLRKQVERFFERFGSHVSQGPIHFGGTFWWKAYAQGFSDQNHNKLKTQVCKVLAMNCTVQANKMTSASTDVSISAGKGSSKIGFSDDLETVVQHSVDKFGGPAETDDHVLWKNNLATNKKTWAVIDRGSTLTPVWDIIRTGHSDQFKDPLRLCSFLIKVYKEITHQEVESTDDIKAVRTVTEAEQMMLSVDEWSLSDAEKHLRDLLRMRRQIKECTTSFTKWIDIFLSNEALQKFLTNVTTAYDDNNMRSLMYLVMETHCHKVKQFPNREQILEWVQGSPEVAKDVCDMFAPIQQFSDLLTVLEKASKEFLQSSEKDLKVTTTCKVTHAINSWIKTSKENGLDDLVLLVLSVTKHVGHREDTFHPLLGSQEIDFLAKELSVVQRKYWEFRNESVLKGQAFSLLTLLTASQRGREICGDKHISLKAFKQTMQGDINTDLNQAISDFLKHKKWELLEEQLRSLLYGTPKLEGNSSSAGIAGDGEATDTSKTEDAVKEVPVDGYPKLNIGLPSPYKELFERLDLLKYYPAKLSNSNLHNINMLSTCSTQNVTEKELWLHFIYRLLTRDVNVRFLCIEPTLQMSSKSFPCSLESFCDFNATDVDSNANEAHIHPMDIYMAVYHCSDDFVRQFIFTQLSKCHFAVPLLVPNLSNQQIELPVWPLQISAITLQATEQSPVTGSVLNTPLPVVSFMRLGTSKNSKSKMLNDMIYKNGHPTFFSRHCRGSTTTQVLLDGVAEISWYLPEGKESDISESCMAFINLHGDACKLPQQVQFLTGISSVIVLLLPENLNDSAIKEGINYFLKCRRPFIALFSGIEATDKRDPYRISAKNRNEAELTQETLYKINQVLLKGNLKQVLEDHFEQGRKQGFIVETEAELKGRQQAKVLMDILYGEKMTKGLKDVHLPLQDKLWMQWCIKDKEFHRIQCKKNMSIEQQRSEIAEEKMKIRADQQKKSLENIFMRKFLQYTVSAEEKERLYFLNWFKKCLDDTLRGNLTDLTKHYNRTWLQYRGASDGEKRKYQTDLCELSKKIKHATVGIQHVFREISQLYESHRSIEESKTIHGVAFDKLPEMGVDLMLSGHPLELMDGDVNYVAVDWVSAVLDKLIHKLGDRRVLVLSVVGLQSSGKSTLLNTMFGLDFAVSSGPCTRGAFMHLLPVEEQIRDELLYDFVLVLDTEGLRSTVTDPDVVVKNDNELATLIIGISDITLINVMGESLCEIQNILQVCFQAFLRMKNVNIKPSCMFVHQNVSEISAKDTNQGGRIQLIEKLDEISRAAAEEENQVVVGFSDIIKFDVNTDVFYFKNLLEGDPPMAPPNPSYSQNVQELKQRVLSISTWQPNCTLLTLSEFSERIKDTWNALLNENFIFNFRNSLDMKVYSDLERDYLKWSWKLRKTALETQRKLNCRVKSGELNTISEAEIKKIFEEIHSLIKTDVDKYFREKNHSDILSQWRVSIDRRLEILKQELTEETYKKGLKEVIQRNLKLELDSKLKDYETDLFQKGMAAASALDNQTVNDDLILEEFKKLWIQWTTDLSAKNPKDTETNIQSLVESALLTCFVKHKDVICNKSEEDFCFDTAKHIKLSFFSKNFRNNSQMNQTGNDITKQILEDISRRIQEKAADGHDITENFIHEILAEIEEMILKYQKSHGFEFTSLYKACLSMYVCKMSTRELKKIYENFRAENDPLAHLMKKKTYFFELYKRYCQGAESIKTFVTVLINSLQEAMLYALSDKLSIDIADYLSHHHEALRGNKSNLEHHIMKHLAEKENFEEYMKYINDPKSFCREFIRECVVKHINDEQMKVSEVLSSSLSQLTEKVLIECSSASEIVREAQGNILMWTDKFCSRLGQEIPLSREDFRTFENLHIDNVQILQESVASSLKDMLEKGRKDPRSILGPGPIIFKLKEKPVDILFEQLSGCWEQCPFCKAVCTNSIPNHQQDHTVEWHRCQAIGGLFHQQRYWKLVEFVVGDCLGKEKYFVLNFCSTSVISDYEFKHQGLDKWIPFKQYRNAGPPYNSWKITPDNEDRLYWKWFICTFSEQLEKLYKFKFADLSQIPDNWKQIKKDKVINEMNNIILRNQTT